MKIEQITYTKEEIWKLCREENVYVIRRYKGYDKKVNRNKSTETTGAHTNDFFRAADIRSLEKLSLKEIEQAFENKDWAIIRITED